MAKNLEKLGQNDTQEVENPVEWFKDLFQIKLGSETSKQALKESFRANKYQKAKVVITSNYDIYLSDMSHHEVMRANGLSQEQMYEGYIVSRDDGETLSLESSQPVQLLRDMLLTLDGGAIQRKFGKNKDISEFIRQACAAKISEYFHELTDKKEDDTYWH